MTSDFSASDYVRRFYRDHLSAQDLTYFRVSVGESDLLVGVGTSQVFSSSRDGVEIDQLKRSVIDELIRVRCGLRAYMQRHPEFGCSLSPVDLKDGAPPIAQQMANAAVLAGVGPMAAVAGAVSHAIGSFLAQRFGDVVVENGGDIFIHSTRSRTVGIYAGLNSKLSDKLAVRLGPDQLPMGICTSAGTIGPSLSFGRADAVTVFSRDTALADAVATAVGNRVVSQSDIRRAIEFGSQIRGVDGIIVVKDDKLGAWGQVELV